MLTQRVADLAAATGASVVVFLEGGRPTFGPKAAELTGAFYRAMYERNYFAPKPEQTQSAMTTTSGN